MAAHVKALSKGTGFLHQHDIDRVNKTAEVSKAVLETAARILVWTAEGDPILRSSSADGTPLRVKKSVKVKLPTDGSTRIRSGKGTSEVMVMNSFYRTIAWDGTVSTKVLLRDPVPVKDKRVDTAFCKLVECWPSLRSWAHEGICIEHYTFDRAMHDSAWHLFEQWHKMKAQERGDSEQLQWKEWCVGTACSLHDAHNAFKWSLSMYAKDVQLMEAAHLAVESLRKSYDQILVHVGRWVAEHVDFVPARGMEDMCRHRVLWDTLGVEPEIAEAIAFTLQLHWCPVGERLYVCEACQENGADAVGLITATLLRAWKIVQFSQSRWLTIGVSARTVVVGLLTGLDSLVQHILDTPHESSPFLGGFPRFLPACKRFMVMASVVSRVVDSVLVIIMEDGRVAKQASPYSFAVVVLQVIADAV